MMSNRATYMAGVMTGAVLVSIAWIIFSWEPKPVEPAGRHSLGSHEKMIQAIETRTAPVMTPAM